jgi:hypothetical protein
MPNDRYAATEWTVDDVMQNAQQYEIEVTKRQAQRVLQSEESHIMDAMVQAGWNVIEEALRRQEFKRGS